MALMWCPLGLVSRRALRVEVARAGAESWQGNVEKETTETSVLLERGSFTLLCRQHMPAFLPPPLEYSSPSYRSLASTKAVSLQRHAAVMVWGKRRSGAFEEPHYSQHDNNKKYPKVERAPVLSHTDAHDTRTADFAYARRLGPTSRAKPIDHPMYKCPASRSPRPPFTYPLPLQHARIVLALHHNNRRREKGIEEGR